MKSVIWCVAAASFGLALGAAACGTAYVDAVEILPAGGTGARGGLGVAGAGAGPAGTAFVPVIGIAAGQDHACALSNGVVACWGWNEHGQLGDGTVSTSRTRPVRVLGLATATAIGAGDYHSCALDLGRHVQCWGDNDESQLGNSLGVVDKIRSIPGEVIALSEVTQISVGGSHACARTLADQVSCWGWNQFGQLGDGTTVEQGVPELLASGLNVAAGSKHTCVWQTGGGAKCTGYNVYGHLGVGDQVNRTMLVNVLGLDGIIALTTGRRQTCAITTSGAAWCWGSNAEGQLGTGTDMDSSVPVPVVGIPSAVAMAAGGFHTCALVNGGVWCWGEGSSGQLGDGLNQASKVPVHVVGLDDAVAIATGDRHSCALRKDGHVVCWGAGKLGQIGDGAEMDRSVPTEVQF